MANKKPSRLLILILLVVAATALLVLEYLPFTILQDETSDEMLRGSLARGICGVCMLFVISYLNYDILNPFKKPYVKSLIFCLPCLLVAAVNFPTSALINGTATITNTDAFSLVLFILECFCIGLMEETVFRGIIFGVVLEKLRGKKHYVFYSVVLSSAIFGLSHLINLFYGAGFNSVIMQVGYTFLIGAMLSVVLLKTQNIWLCVTLHALFDIGGTIVTRLGSGTPWNTFFVVTTAIAGVLCGLHIIFALRKTNTSFIEQPQQE